MQSPTTDTTWNEIAPVIDEALNEMTDQERQTILLRFFEQKSMRDLGVALCISEDAAKMRVSRAMEKLRSMLSARGVSCGLAALSTLLLQRSVEAAPGTVAMALATLKIPAGVVGGTGAVAGLFGLSQAKLIYGSAAVAVICATTFVLLRLTANREVPVHPKSENAISANSFGVMANIGPANRDTIASDTNAPDPRKMLREVARARQRIASGQMELQVFSCNFNRLLDGTNSTQLKIVFDGGNRRFDSVAREYAYTEIGPDVADKVDAQRRELRLDREAAVKAGLLTPFPSHHVTVCTAREADGIIDFWDTGNGRPSTSIRAVRDGSPSFLFDPRQLGLNVYMGMEQFQGLDYPDPLKVNLVGKETLNGTLAWHISVAPTDENYWLDVAQPTRVLQYANSGGKVVSRFDETNPKDPLPIEVTITTTASELRVVRSNTQYNVAIPAVSWTLAGLGMPIGTDVGDWRIHLNIGYWNGSGLAEHPFPKKSAETNAPDLSTIVALLDTDPGSPAALDGAQWILLNTPDGDDVEKAAQVIEEEHASNTNLLRLARELVRTRPRCSRNLLETIIAKNPSAEVCGNACFTLGTILKDKADHGRNQEETRAAEQLFTRVITEFAAVKKNGWSLADLAKPELFELQQLGIGQPAPNTTGVDLEGHPLKLSNYHGKLVLLVFWWNGDELELESLRDLLTRFADKPFAIVGVYGDNDVAKAREIAAKLQITWPSFYDGRSGPISKLWNNNSWPTFTIIDTEGIIRQRELTHVFVKKAVEDLLMK